MWNRLIVVLVAVTACWISVDAFVASSSKPFVSSNTALHISSWTTKGGKWNDNVLKNPAERIQDYLKEPAAVEARDTIQGTCFVSGVVNAKDRTDQFLFDLLNHEDSAFEYTKIVAYVDDAKFSKKRLLSRSARYTGLLDKLEFLQSGATGALPTPDVVSEDVTTWLAVVGVNDNIGREESSNSNSNSDKLQEIQQIVNVAKQVKSLQNLAILVMNANGMDAGASQNIVQQLQDTGITYTVVAVGRIEDRPEGNTWYHYRPFGTPEAVLPEDAVFSREESYRMITELLQLQCGSNKAVTFAEVYNANVTEAKLIKGLREAGYARPQEIDHMIRDGPDVRIILYYMSCHFVLVEGVVLIRYVYTVMNNADEKCFSHQVANVHALPRFSLSIFTFIILIFMFV